MARKPSPWYWKERNQWLVTIDGKRHKLGEHPKDAPKPSKGKSGWNAPKQILDIFHKMMSQEQPVQSDWVACVLDDFQTWCSENRAKRTADRYFDFLQDFIASYGKYPCSSINASHVTKWLSGKETWNSTTKRNAITALQRAFNWAVTNRGLERNPIRGMEKPSAKRRKTTISPEDFDAILSVVKDQEFRDLLIVSYDTGLRPQELKKIEARHVYLETRRVVFPAEEGKGGIARAIYFPTERSLEVLQRLCSREGVIFRNTLGNPWTGFAIKNRFDDLEKVIGKRIRHYDFRRTFITRKIIAGVDSHVVAALSGHRSTAMIDNHYSAIAEDPKFMLEMAMKEKPSVASDS